MLLPVLELQYSYVAASYRVFAVCYLLLHAIIERIVSSY